MRLKSFLTGFISTLALIVIIIPPLSAAKNEERSSNENHDCHKHKGCNKNIIRIKHLPYVISKPGKYYLCKDLNFAPKNPGSSQVWSSVGITINADNVELNLKGYTLLQTNAPTSAPTPDYHVVLPPSNFQTIGVLIKNTRQNVKVFNGTIGGFANAISCEGTPGAGGIGCSRISLNNLTLNDNASAGIWVQPGCRDVEVTDITVNNAGFDPSINTVRSLNIVRGGPTGFGIVFQGDYSFNTSNNSYILNNPIQNVVVKNCFISDVGYARQGGSFPIPLRATGLLLAAVQDSDVSNVIVNNVQSIVFPRAFGRTFCNNSNFRLCAGSRVRSQGLLKVYFDDTNNSCLMEDCTAYDYSSNLSQNAVDAWVAAYAPNPPAIFIFEAEGIKSSTNTDMVYRNCTASLGIGIATFTPNPSTLGQIFGIIFNGPQGKFIVENCHAMDITVNSVFDPVPSNRSNLASPAGIAVQNLGLSQDVILRGCTASGIKNLNVGLTVAGIANYNPNVLIERCVAEDVTVNLIASPTATAAGFLIANTTIVQNCIAKEVRGNGIGFWLTHVINVSGPVDGVLCTLVDNEAIQNDLFGFADGSAGPNAKRNVFKRNEAFNNGPAGSTSSNYAGIIANTPIRSWVLGNPPAPEVAGAELDNLSIGLIP
jgi:hypothetical protein